MVLLAVLYDAVRRVAPPEQRVAIRQEKSAPIIRGFHAWRELVQLGPLPAQEYLAGVGKMSRYNSRTPMQWSAAPQAGLKSGTKPWLPVSPNCPTANAERQQSQAQSVLSRYRQIIRLRPQRSTQTLGD